MLMLEYKLCQKIKTVLDFVELGNKGLNYYYNNPMSDPGFSIKNFPFKPLFFY